MAQRARIKTAGSVRQSIEYYEMFINPRILKRILLSSPYSILGNDSACHKLNNLC